MLSLLIGILGLSSCMAKPDENQGKDSDKDSVTESEILKNQFNRISNKYITAKKLIVSESTTVKTKTEERSATRVTYVDDEEKYTYAKITSGIDSGFIYQKENDFYYRYNKMNDKVEYLDTRDVYKTLGFSKIFKETGYIFKNQQAKLNIINPQITEYEVLLNNINLDFNTQYKYNPSLLMVSIDFNEEKINKITFDLSLIYGSFYESVIREVEIKFDDFIKENISFDDNNESLNDKYLVKTDNVLNTYMIEMIDYAGDAIYIKSGDFDMLIDAGGYKDGASVRRVLEEHCTDKKLDVLIGTHGHGDHLSGFGNGALNPIESIRLIIDFGYIDNNCQPYKNVRDEFINKGADYYSAYECVRYQNGASKKFKFSEDLSLEVLDTNQYAPKGKNLSAQEFDAENDFSVVVKITFKDNTYLFTGDLAGALGDKFTNALKKEDIQNMTVYKAAHHGATSHSSNNTSFMNYINPKICISSAAILDPDKPYDHTASDGSISYQHPRPGFVRWILNTPSIKTTKNYYFNGTMGTIHLTDDGTHLPSVEGMGATIGYKMNGIKVTGENNSRFVETRMYKEYYER